MTKPEMINLFVMVFFGFTTVLTSILIGVFTLILTVAVN
jgi:hypothetical protein